MDDQNDDGSLGYTVLHNSSCQHAAPTFINLMNAAILRLAAHNKNMTIQTRNHPLPMTKSQHLQHHVCHFHSILLKILFQVHSLSIIKVSLILELNSVVLASHLRFPCNNNCFSTYELFLTSQGDI